MSATSVRNHRPWKFAGVGLVIVAIVMVALRLWDTSTPSSSAATTSAACLKVSAALSDGPDPSADPIGYAQAQILPLHGIITGDAPLQQAITNLSNAYKTFYKDGGSTSAASLVRHASQVVDDYCPGATS